MTGSQRTPLLTKNEMFKADKISFRMFTCEYACSRASMHTCKHAAIVPISAAVAEIWCHRMSAWSTLPLRATTRRCRCQQQNTLNFTVLGCTSTGDNIHVHANK
jgi:hypothetical protein